MTDDTRQQAPKPYSEPYWDRVRHKPAEARRADETQVGGTHYKDMAMQPWEAMEAILTHEEFVGYLKGCIIKYSMRQGLKTEGDADKARHYAQKLREVNGRAG